MSREEGVYSWSDVITNYIDKDIFERFLLIKVLIVFLKLSELLMFTYKLKKVNLVLQGTFPRLNCF